MGRSEIVAVEIIIDCDRQMLYTIQQFVKNILLATKKIVNALPIHIRFKVNVIFRLFAVNWSLLVNQSVN